MTTRRVPAKKFIRLRPALSPVKASPLLARDTARQRALVPSRQSAPAPTLLHPCGLVPELPTVFLSLIDGHKVGQSLATPHSLARMNLLELLRERLDGPKMALAVQLLNKPWHAEDIAVRQHLPAKLADLFIGLKVEALARLSRQHGLRPPFLHKATSSVTAGVRVESSARFAYGAGHDRYWIDQAFTQVLEDLEEDGYQIATLTASDVQALIHLYTVAHACLFAITNLVSSPRSTGGQIDLARDPSALEAHRLYWFSHYSAHQSNVSDHQMIMSVLNESGLRSTPMHRRLHVGSDALTRLTSYFADKHLSILADYLHLVEEEEHPAVDALFDRIELIVYVYVCMIEQQLQSRLLTGEVRLDRLLPCFIDRGSLSQAGLSETAIREILSESLESPIGDRLLIDVGGGRLQIGDIALKFALQTYCGQNLTSIQTLGKWFDDQYLQSYIRERVPGERYRVFPGIKEPRKGYDIDLIIEDTRRGLLFFCQAKHRIVPMRPHLRDETREYMTNGRILNGFKQLNRLRENIDSPSVLSRVRESTGKPELTSTYLVERARYLMVHNIENLDLCTSGSIAMYEWNTLRNLLKGTVGLVHRGHDVLPDAKLRPEFELENPHQVADLLWRWYDASIPRERSNTSPTSQWNALLASQLCFTARKSLFMRSQKLLSLGASELRFPVI